jgi:hypothetical protein
MAGDLQLTWKGHILHLISPGAEAYVCQSPCLSLEISDRSLSSAKKAPMDIFWDFALGAKHIELAIAHEA